MPPTITTLSPDLSPQNPCVYDDEWAEGDNDLLLDDDDDDDDSLTNFADLF